MTRDETLDRYRHLRTINRELNDATLTRVSTTAKLGFARRIGLVQEKILVMNSDDEFSLIADLAVYVSKDGRSCGIDRFARDARFAPGSDHALVLNAMLNSRFTIFEVERRHEIAGLVIHDVMTASTLQFIDIGYEATVPDGQVLVGRLLDVGDFVMTSGLSVPVSAELAADLVSMRSRLPAGPTSVDRFVTEIFRSIVRTNALSYVEYLDLDAESEAA
jgi:hypothetical protein